MPFQYKKYFLVSRWSGPHSSPPNKPSGSASATAQNSSKISAYGCTHSIAKWHRCDDVYATSNKRCQVTNICRNDDETMNDWRHSRDEQTNPGVYITITWTFQRNEYARKTGPWSRNTGDINGPYFNHRTVVARRLQFMSNLSQANSAFYPQRDGKWVPAKSAVTLSGWIVTCTIRERHRDEFLTIKRCTNLRLLT